jgi:ABC-type bacteriocin/lantibiotic exporter with double-glycine peptidase domain
MEAVDNQMPVMVQTWWFCMLACVGTITVIIVSTPLFIVVAVPACTVYVFVMVYFIATTRQLKRLEAVTKSPVYAYFQETVQVCTVHTCARTHRVPHQFAPIRVSSCSSTNHKRDSIVTCRVCIRT